MHCWFKLPNNIWWNADATSHSTTAAFNYAWAVFATHHPLTSPVHHSACFATNCSTNNKVHHQFTFDTPWGTSPLTENWVTLQSGCTNPDYTSKRKICWTSIHWNDKLVPIFNVPNRYLRQCIERKIGLLGVKLAQEAIVGEEEMHTKGSKQLVSIATSWTLFAQFPCFWCCPEELGSSPRSTCISLQAPEDKIELKTLCGNSFLLEYAFFH